MTVLVEWQDQMQRGARNSNFWQPDTKGGPTEAVREHGDFVIVCMVRWLQSDGI